jgi:hypothetical protein
MSHIIMGLASDFWGFFWMGWTIAETADGAECKIFKERRLAAEHAEQAKGVEILSRLSVE